MRKALCLLGLLMAASAVYAELQNVEIGGEIRIRGRYWHQVATAAREGRLLGGIGRSRAVGDRGGTLGSLTSLVDFDDRGGDTKFVEQRTSLFVKADFTNNVGAYIEFDDYERWGQDFRSNYLTGVDARAVSNDDVEVIQAYIDVNELYGQPLRVRIGRQEIVMGKAWLVGSQISPCLHMSYDGIRFTYEVDDYVIDAWWTKLAENSPNEEDGDVDFYGVYGTYKAFEPVDISLYWLYVRDAAARNDTQGAFLPELFEDIVGLDDYGVTNFHTVGLRAWGTSNAWDYDLELAYQFGNADAVGATFPVASILGIYGDDDANFNNWAADLAVGYTFDVNWKPRIYIGGAYFGGEDNREISFWEWLSPFRDSSASVSFNRLFSSIWYTNIFDILGGAANFSNFHQVRVGVSAKPTEKLDTGVDIMYFGINKAFDWPPYILLGSARVPIFPGLAFWTDESDKDLGILTHLWVKYNYSKDLFVKVGWEHLFSGEATYNGSFAKMNGLDLLAGSDDADADYLYFDMGLKF